MMTGEDGIQDKTDRGRRRHGSFRHAAIILDRLEQVKHRCC
ncbi:MAG: hypothetical protein ACI8T1_004163 [Verrucomicrobiales bacterium]